MDILIYDKDFDVISVADDPWVTDISEDILDEWMDDHPGAVVLDYPKVNKMDVTILLYLSQIRESMRPFLSETSNMLHC